MVNPKARSGDDGVACDYCNEHRAVLYCRADSAKLCLLCDNLVHSANALSRKHLRSQICDNCASQPVSSRCDTDNLLLCQDCDWDAHGTTTSSHRRSPVDAFSGCPSALHLASAWGLDLLAAANSPPPQQHIVKWTSCYQDPPDNDANNHNNNSKNPFDSSTMYDVNKSLLQDLMVPSGNWNDRIIYSTTDAVGSKKQKQQVVMRQLIELFKREGVGVDCGGEELVSATMVLRAPSAGFLRSFLAVAQARLASSAAPSRSILQTPILEKWQPALLPAITIPIPGLVSDLWESVLRAVPKKKTSHMKKRHRQMAGKALKDVTALNTCSGCGRTKRAHVLCPHCVASIKKWFGNDFTPRNTNRAESKESSDASSKGPEQ